MDSDDEAVEPKQGLHELFFDIDHDNVAATYDEFMRDQLGLSREGEFPQEVEKAKKSPKDFKPKKLI